ncbi:MAG: response regulator transcription factor [Nitrospira sp.]|nr:response regulator transcription factor [Nitrospira sp.]MBX3333151.1 response regulator transcription factor [Nitrospira sp.]MDR4463390.1 response regulator [Nitrospira sp.]MDR4467168.1 response regulator [Nitrospira sp.]
MEGKIHNPSRSQQDKGWICPGPSRTAPSSLRTIRVVIAHDYQAFRRGLCALLDGEQDLRVVSQVDTVDEMLSEARRTRAHAVLMGAGLSHGVGPHSHNTLPHILSSIRIISLTKGMNAEEFSHAVKTGVRGFLPENVGRTELIRAIRTVAKGGLYFVLSSS